MWSRTLWVIFAVLAVAGVAVATTTAVRFLPQQNSTYSGPGAPLTTSGVCDIPGELHWCSQGFEVNSTEFNVTMCFTTNTTDQVGVVAFLMNGSSYHNFSVNSTLTHIGESPIPRCLGPTPYGDGPGTFCWVWVDTTERPVDVQYSIFVEVPT